MSSIQVRGNAIVMVGGVMGVGTSCCCAYYCWATADECYYYTFECLQAPQDKVRISGPYATNTCDSQCPEDERPECCTDPDCPSGYECIEGECWPPDPYYCCYDSLDESDNPVGPAYCNAGPCESEALTASGPHRTSADCEAYCQEYTCAPSPCTEGETICIPDAEGEYLTYGQCIDDCPETPVDPCTIVSGPFGVAGPPYVLTGTQTGSGGVTYTFDTDLEPNKLMCVSYVSETGNALRVQILGPDMDDCDVVTDDVIKRDSGWRGHPACDCTSLRPAGALVGRPKGFLKWTTKQRFSAYMKVRVYSPCVGSTWKVSVNCNSCPTISEEPCCACTACVVAAERIQDDRQASAGTGQPEGHYQIGSTAFGGPWDVVWKAGYPAALKCRYFWWKNLVQCNVSRPGFFDKDTLIDINYWRLFTCEDGVLVNRTGEAVETAKLGGAPGVGPDYTPAATVGGFALTGGEYVFPAPVFTGNDPTGTDQCPLPRVGDRALLDPLAVCP
jgi:hypothetical protein